MKSFSFYLLSLALLAFLGACGKNNESGKNSWQYGNPYYGGNGNPYVSPGQLPGQIQALANNYPCIGGYQGQMYPNQQYPSYPMNPSYPGIPQANQRIVVQVPLTGSTIISSMQPYVGVTSFGDIAMITSNGQGSPPVFTAYLCPRGFSQSGQGQLLGVKVGSNAIRCKSVPAITAADVILPGGLIAKFRSLDGGAYTSCGIQGIYSQTCNIQPFAAAGLCQPY